MPGGEAPSTAGEGEVVDLRFDNAAGALIGGFEEHTDGLPVQGDRSAVAALHALATRNSAVPFGSNLMVVDVPSVTCTRW